jgi:hypothetical protein
MDPHQKRSMQISKLNCNPTSSTLKGITPFARKHNNLKGISTSIKTPTLNKKFITTFVKIWALEPSRMCAIGSKTSILHQS